MNRHSARQDDQKEWKPAVSEFCRRLEGDYQSEVGRYAKGIDCWGNSTTLGFDVRLGHARGGPMWGDHVQYAKRVGFLGLFGPRIQLRDLADVEKDFRREIDDWLAKQKAEGRTQGDSV